MRDASIAMSKQSAGLRGATTGSGDSECRPYMASIRSACSGLVGRPVEGPPRWMSSTTSGSSRLTARLSVSPLSARPGPEVEVNASAPPKAAPTADAAAAISSSAWNVRTPKFFFSDISCRMSDAGVIGYEPKKTGRRASWPATTQPHASAVLPFTLVYSPGASGAGFTS